MEKAKQTTLNLPWKVLTPEEILQDKNPFVSNIITKSRMVPKETCDLILKTVAEDQADVFKNIENTEEELDPLLGDLQKINWDKLKTFKGKVKSYDPKVGQIGEEGEIEILKPFEIKELSAKPDNELLNLGKEKMPQLARITLAAGIDLPFFGETSAAPIGAYYIDELKSSFLGIQAKDLRMAQQRYNFQIPWYIMIPEGKRGDIIKEHFNSHQHFGLNPDQVKFFAQPGGMPLLDPNGDLFMDFERERIMFCPEGSGEVLFAFKTSGMLDEALSWGARYAFLSNSSNLGADISSDFFAMILGKHIKEGMPVTAELVGRQLIREGGIPIILKGKHQILEHFIFSTRKQAEAQYYDTPLNKNNLIINLEDLNQKLTSGLELPLWIKPAAVREYEYFRQVYLVGDITGILPTLLLKVPNELRDIAPPRVSLLDQAVNQYQEKQKKLGGLK